jgi:hypothetical protein
LNFQLPYFGVLPFCERFADFHFAKACDGSRARVEDSRLSKKLGAVLNRNCSDVETKGRE